MGNTSSTPALPAPRWTGRPQAVPQPPPQSNGFVRFADQFHSLEDVQGALRREGLESSNLIIAIDYTKSNEWTGKTSFGGRSLHALGEVLNPYQLAMGVVARTLSSFDDDQLIPVVGFGDATTGDQRVFSFKPGDAPCHGLDEVQAAYRAVTPHVRLSGPTSFAPAIHHAMKLVVESGNQYHILLLIADGQVTRSSDLPPGQFSPQEHATINAIVEASYYPLSIVMVGVGDGPWDMMNHFDDALPTRRFDNFQFVNFTSVMCQHWQDPVRLETQFAVQALQEVPPQYRAIQRLGLLSRPTPLPPHLRIPPPAPCPIRASTSGAPPPQPTAYPPPPSAYGTSVGGSTRTSYDRPSAAPHAAVGGVGPGGVSGGGGGPPGGFYDRPSASGRWSGGTSVSGATAVRAAEALFICPITQELMEDPVVASDGCTYERAAITQWLATHDTSPMTNAPMSHKQLIPNHALRSSIMEHKAALVGGQQ